MTDVLGAGRRILAAHVQPVDAWYLIPIESVGRAKSLRMYPGIEIKSPGYRRAQGGRLRKMKGVRHAARWEKWRDRWDVLEEMKSASRSRR